MNKFKKPYSSRPSAGRSEGRPTTRPRFGAATRGPRSEAFQKFDAVCSNCGKKCQVPFRPDGEKPVYCKDCFGVPRDAMKGRKMFIAPSASAAPSIVGGKSIADLTRQIAAMNTKIDTMLKILQEGSAAE